jgi:hypothetical protein
LTIIAAKLINRARRGATGFAERPFLALGLPLFSLLRPSVGYGQRTHRAGDPGQASASVE